MLFYLALVLVIPLIAKGYKRLIIISLLIILVTSLFIVEVKNPDIVHHLQGNTSKITDIYTAAIYLSMVSAFLMVLIMHSFRKEHQKVERLNNTKDRFLSIIAHDLKSPLSAMSQLGQVLSENHNEIPPENRERLINSITNTSKRTYNLLENLLEWAKSETGLIKVVPVKLKVNEIIDSIINLLSDNIANKNINLHIDIKKKLLARGDNHMIHTVIRNLLSNAVKFTPNKEVLP